MYHYHTVMAFKLNNDKSYKYRTGEQDSLTQPYTREYQLQKRTPEIQGFRDCNKTKSSYLAPQSNEVLIVFCNISYCCKVQENLDIVT